LASKKGGRQGANLSLQLITRRRERCSIVLPSNQRLRAGVEVFGDNAIASAILGRLLNHATTINIKGESNRLKKNLRAGLLRPAPTAEAAE
jgi:DNA replication protein DnaC